MIDELAYCQGAVDHLFLKNNFFPFMLNRPQPHRQPNGGDCLCFPTSLRFLLVPEELHLLPPLYMIDFCSSCSAESDRCWKRNQKWLSLLFRQPSMLSLFSPLRYIVKLKSFSHLLLSDQTNTIPFYTLCLHQSRQHFLHSSLSVEFFLHIQFI